VRGRLLRWSWIKIGRMSSAAGSDPKIEAPGVDGPGLEAYSSGRMRSLRSLLLASVVLFSAAFPLLAHHALASEFKINQMIMLTGMVTKVEWSNPHARLYLDAKGEGGDVMKWDFEMASPNLLTLHGWKIDTVRRGDRVTVSAYPSRDGSNKAYATKVSRTAP
jgi:hypothetical protein